MPRTPKSQLSRNGIVKATAFPELRTQNAVLKPDDLKRVMFGRPTTQDTYGRQRYGRSLTLDRIERALRSAQQGYMRDLTDMARETIGVDPHLTAVLSKRIGAAASVPYEVVAATGPGTDPELAQAYANFVREQLAAIPRWKQAVKQLAWGLFDGRSALEIQWVTRADAGVDRVGGQWRAAELTWIHPRRLQFGPDREIRLNDTNMSGYSFSPIGLALRDMPFKFIEFKPQLFGDYPEFEGLAPKCMYWSFFKRFGARERNVLLELFGKPWRIITVDDESDADDDDLRDAETIADQLGNTVTARMPKGTKLDMIEVNADAGKIHQDVITESDRQLSKLVLGQTGTTDGLPGALNGGAQSLVMFNEQMLILQGDAELLAEAIEDYLTDAIIALNFGVEALINAPRFVMNAQAQPDRKADTERMKLALDLGLSVPVEQAYELTGFRKPEKDEAVIRMVDMPNGMGGNTRVATITAPELALADANMNALEQDVGTPALPAVNAPAAGAAAANDSKGALALELTPSTIADIFTVNEGRKSQGAGPLMMPDGTRDPDGDLPINEFKAKRAATAEAQGAVVGKTQGAIEAKDVPGAENITPPASAVPVPGGGGAPAAPAPQLDPATEAVKKAIGLERGASLEDLEAVSAELVVALLRSMAGNVLAAPHKHDASCVLLAKQVQPASVHGNIETLISKGVRESARVTDKWVSTIVDSVKGLTKPHQINARLTAVADHLDLLPFARSIERRLVHSSMTGSLDSQWEDVNDQAIAPEKFPEPEPAATALTTRKATLAGVPGASPDFTSMAYQEALKYFMGKTPIPKSTFAKLNAAAKARSFTVAGLASDHALNIAKSELGNAINEGADMALFAERLNARFTAAGFTTLNPSHLETVFRTNLVDSYNVGRKAEMSTPTALKERPYWIIRTVKDDRQRQTHGAHDGWILRASDPFWRKVGGPPWGFNCRCRLSTIREAKLAGREIRNGVEVRGIPDVGFEPGALWSDEE
jgi:phage gp29-like protein